MITNTPVCDPTYVKEAEGGSHENIPTLVSSLPGLAG